MPAYVGAIDQGTTSTRFIVFDATGAIVVGRRRRSTSRSIRSRAGSSTIPLEIWRNTQDVIADALATKGLAPADLAAVGITNQRETTLLWDRRTGRAAPQRAGLAGHARRRARRRASPATAARTACADKTGLPLASYFSGLKLRWLLDTRAGRARRRREAGDALFGTIDTWLVWNLTGGRTAACTSPT